MAYDVNTDYKAKQDALKKQQAATTSQTEKSALQAQIDAAEQARTEKLASDLTKYGKFASDTELDSAAGLMAQNQIGTGYEMQKANLNTSYDNAKQNANNDALSRGMGRSTYVSDRMANLDSQRANALQGVDASKALALQNAKTGVIDNYRTNTANALLNEKSEYDKNQMTHYQDYQAEINKVLGDGDPTNDWQADKLQGWRNEKLLAQEATALKAAKTTSSSGGGGSYGGGGNGGNDDGTPVVEFNAQPQTQSGFGNATMTDINDALAQVKQALASGETLSSLGAKIYAQKGTMDATTFGAYMAAIQLAAKNSK